MLESLVNSTPVSSPAFPEEFEALKAYADEAEATIRELRAEVGDLRSTVRSLNKALETVSVSSPAGPSEKFEKIELFSKDREYLRTFIAKLRTRYATISTEQAKLRYAFNALSSSAAA